MAREISANGFKYIRKDVHDFVVLSNKRGIESAIDLTKDLVLDLTNKIDTPGSGLLNSIQVGSNQMPLTAWNHTEENRHRDRKKYLVKFQGVA